MDFSEITIEYIRVYASKQLPAIFVAKLTMIAVNILVT